MTLQSPFSPPPENLQLTDGKVHVFCATLDQPLWRMEQLAETLSADERQRAARFHFGKDKNRYVAGRGMLREILGRLLGAMPGELIFTYGIHGKPRLAVPTEVENPLHFNVSYSDSLVVYAVSREHEVGIDVERIRPIHEVEDIAAHFFSEQERVKWRSLPDDAKTTAFFNCWTRKEALLKASGEGLRKPLKQIEVFFGGDFCTSEQFSLRSLPLALNYIAAVAAKCCDLHVSYWCPR